jgi:hypothetical protein
VSAEDERMRGRAARARERAVDGVQYGGQCERPLRDGELGVVALAEVQQLPLQKTDG